MKNLGLVFNIQHFSIQDGPGIRTVVFVKGCPLRCRWCGNPESQAALPELAWTEKQCIHCGSCAASLKDLGVHFDEGGRLLWKNQGREILNPAGSKEEGMPGSTVRCSEGIAGEGSDNVQDISGAQAEVQAAAAGLRARVQRACPTEAFHLIGKYMTSEEVLTEVEKDRPFYQTSGGGLTVSGGEPLLQASFTSGLLKGAHERGISTCIETAGYAPWEAFRAVLPHLDCLYMDIKCLDPEIHRRHTGVSNRLILGNLDRIRDAFPELKIRLRTPVIPGFNDSEEEIRAIAALASDRGCEYELLKYHRLGIPKYESLNRPYPMGDADLEEERFERLRECARMVQTA